MEDHWHLPLHHNMGVDYLEENCDCGTSRRCPALSGPRHLSLNHDGRVNNLVHHLSDEQQLRSLHSFRGQYLTCTTTGTSTLPKNCTCGTNTTSTTRTSTTLLVYCKRNLFRLETQDHKDLPLRDNKEANNTSRSCNSGTSRQCRALSGP